MDIKLESIDKAEALRYLCFRKGNEIPETIGCLIDECSEELLKVISPKYIYQCFPLEFTDSGIRVCGTNLILKGNDIKNHLEGCEKVILLAVTLSISADRLIQKYEAVNMTKALITDSLSNSAIEQVCDIAETEILPKYPDFHNTWRFSAGYGDFPIEIQNSFLDVLNAQKRIGLCATSSHVLTPKKSVTAVIGLSEKPVSRKKRGCSVCNLNKTCLFRKNGSHCE